MRVAVHHTEEFEAAAFGITIGSQVVAAVDLVDLGGRRRVRTRIEDLDALAHAREQPARLERIPIEGVADHLEIRVLRKPQHQRGRVASRRRAERDVVGPLWQLRQRGDGGTASTHRQQADRRDPEPGERTPCDGVASR